MCNINVSCSRRRGETERDRLRGHWQRTSKEGESRGGNMLSARESHMLSERIAVHCTRIGNKLTEAECNEYIIFLSVYAEQSHVYCDLMQCCRIWNQQTLKHKLFLQQKGRTFSLAQAFELDSASKLDDNALKGTLWALTTFQILLVKDWTPRAYIVRRTQSQKSNSFWENWFSSNRLGISSFHIRFSFRQTLTLRQAHLVMVIGTDTGRQAFWVLHCTVHNVAGRGKGHYLQKLVFKIDRRKIFCRVVRRIIRNCISRHSVQV